MRPPKVEAALLRLREADESRRAAITELIALGWIRGRGVVGELGERYALSFYGGELAAPSNRSYDLTTPDGRLVEVRTLHMTPENNRTSMGRHKGGYDLLFAIRLDKDYEPVRAIEVPAHAVTDYTPVGGRLSWTAVMENDARVRRIASGELLSGQARGVIRSDSAARAE